MLTLIVVLGSSPIYSQAAVNTESGSFHPDLQSFEMGAFTYRISFRLADGTEVLLIRGSWRLIYLYQHHQPTVTEHYISSFVGFYYGQTALGRRVVQNVHVEEAAFYPKWINSAGFEFDLLGISPLFHVNESIPDGQLAGGTMMLDREAISRYMAEFGGTFVFSGLEFVLDDGTEVILSEETIHVEIAKHQNDQFARAAEISGDSELIYESDSAIATLFAAEGAASLIVLVDLALLVSAWGLAGAFIILAILHRRGRITLPIGRLKTTMQKGVNAFRRS
jgi:hypothetical protein